MKQLQFYFGPDAEISLKYYPEWVEVDEHIWQYRGIQVGRHENGFQLQPNAYYFSDESESLNGPYINRAKCKFDLFIYCKYYL